jgi:hypothetical protein
MKLLLLIAILASATSNSQASDLRVRLGVFSSDPSWSADQLAKLVFDQVAHLKGVTLAHENPQYDIRCAAIPLKRTSVSGYAVSIAVLSSDGRFLWSVVREDSSLEGLARDIRQIVREGLVEDVENR